MNLVEVSAKRQGGGSGSSAGLEDWVLLVLSRRRSKIFEVATLKSFMGILF